MFDHLDDSRPFEPGGAFRHAVARRARQLRWRQRAAASTLAVVTLAGVLGAGALYVERRDQAIDRVELRTLASTDGATNVLLVGSDARQGEDDGRADTIAVMRFEPAGSIRLLSIPRDLWIAEGGPRINSTLVEGPQELIDNVTLFTGIPIDHYLALDLDGFRNLVDDVGGVPVAIDRPIRNEPTGMNLPSTECSTLDGEMTLALVRSRHLEHQTADGRWVADPFGDLGRIARAHVLLTIALDRLAALGTDPIALDRLSRTLADHATLDEGLTLPKLLDLGRMLMAARVDRISAETLPVESATDLSGAAGLRMAADAEAVVARYGSSGTVTSEGIVTGTPVDVPAAVDLGPC